MSRLLTYLVIAAVIFAAFYFRAWQCQEMFPNASIYACLFWK